MITVPNISRYKAASIHLAISAGIAALVLSLMLAVWYPPPLFDAMGGKELVLLVVGVDVTIGPLITLIIFDTRKKELLFDLAIVATLQLAALGYGVYAMQSGRPVFIVFVENHFAVVSAAELEPEAIAQARWPEFRTLPLTGPKWAVADMPTDPKELSDITFARLAGLGAQNLPRYYAPYAERRSLVLAHSMPFNISGNLPAEFVAEIERTLLRSGRGPNTVRWLPVTTKQATLTALLDGESGEIISIAAIGPPALGDQRTH
jgi:hypothetical protein